LLLTIATATAFAWTGVANAQNAAKTAVEAAKKICSGKTITIVWEAGLQSLDPTQFSGPLWEKETGCKVKVVEVPTAEMFTKIMQEFRAGTGAYDALNVIPAWMPDLAQAGALEVLDPYVDKYGFRDELKKIAPTYRDNQMTVNGKIYGFPDDGDVFLFYYRKDIFARADLKKAFKDKYKYDLAPPKTWKQFDEIGSFLTEALKKDGIYGAAFFREPPLYDVHVPGALPRGRRQVLRCGHEGDGEQPDRRQGVRRHAQREPLHAARRREIRLRGKSRDLPEGRERDDHFLAAVWPVRRRLSRQREGAFLGAKIDDRRQRSATHFLQAAIPNWQQAFALSVASTSKQKEAAYLFIQWLNSEEISNKRVQLPYALRGSFPRFTFHQPRLSEVVAGCEGLPRGLASRRANGTARPLAYSDRQVRRSAAPGHQQTVGR
jgi:multiple sugar transport system substrate-binding protein